VLGIQYHLYEILVKTISEEEYLAVLAEFRTAFKSSISNEFKLWHWNCSLNIYDNVCEQSMQMAVRE